MWRSIQERLLPVIIALTALSVSASAAFYSVSGLSKLFAGASLEVIIMAGSLEVAKLVIASLLYQYRKTLPKLLKYYLTSAAVVLVLITSMGIYGFLSAAYQETASRLESVDLQVELLESRRDGYRSQLLIYNEEKEELNRSISDLRKGLAGNVIQYKDSETGQIITTTSSSNRRAFERQLDQAMERQGILSLRVDKVNEELFSIETEIVEVQASSDVAGELGPLKYLSSLTGVPMDRVINILILTIVFVFDPLAIALVIAANYAFDRLEPIRGINRKRFVFEDPKEEPEPDFTKDFEEEVIVPKREPGMYHNGRKIKATPDSLGQKWAVVFEDNPNQREKIWKKDIETVV